MTHSLSREALFKTNSPPCCLRINPLDPSIVYFGTYTLIEGNNRKGSIEIWRIGKKKDVDSSFSTDFPDDGDVSPDNLPILGTCLKVIPTHGAVLDIKIDPKSIHSIDSSLLLATASSTGNITFCKIEKDDGTAFIEVADVQLFPEATLRSDETLITSINFHSNKNYLVFTATSGVVGYYDYESPTKFPEESSVRFFGSEHSLEAWFADWGHHGLLDNVVFSGGDDAKLIAHDIREPMAIMETSRIHDAGIVSILTGRQSWGEKVTDQFVIWTGGYDDNLCVLDLRAGLGSTGGSLIPGLPPIVREKHNLGGGVWRMIPSPHTNDSRVMTCNMYDGGRVLSYNEQTAQQVEVVGNYKGEHSSITYGGDWVGDKIISCSFYDNIVQVWNGGF